MNMEFSTEIAVLWLVSKNPSMQLRSPESNSQLSLFDFLQRKSVSAYGKRFRPLANPAARLGGSKSFGGTNLTYPHFQLSPRI